MLLLFLIYIFIDGASKFGQGNSINLFVIHSVIRGSICGIYDMGNIVSENGYVYMKCDLQSVRSLYASSSLTELSVDSDWL